ncbi:MAG: 16S rRNA (guanine(527)-N(7))-methyltransferase RsmG [Treponemataceae bacterium]|jgi:16S rRNA (guanine527-N7)-methyltransferase|nr:16S rRNA (guanine(527)-N(7))-methyltransferase RsmG [Treponemataceae bacterium]
MDYLHEGLVKLNFSTETIPAIENNLKKYVNELILFNSAYDLVGAETTDEIVIRHILDSLSAYHIIRKLVDEKKANGASELCIADIGSGGGLPGIPLAICMEDVHFRLIERMSKRCLFLENCVAILGLTNVKVENIELERVPQESIDISVFRAFRPLEYKMTKRLIRVLKHGGYLAAYKAREEKIIEEMSKISELIPEYQRIPLDVPYLTDKGEYERNLVLVQRP